MRWDAQPLAGFESHAIGEIAQTYHLIVLDHPGLGGAVSTGALAPLDELVEERELDAWASGSVGGAFDSYRYLGHQWAAPIDAAAQVLVLRAREVADPPPETWRDVLDLAADREIAIPTAGPHTLLSFLGICAAHDPAFVPDEERLVPRDVALEAIEILARLLSATPAEHLEKNPIELLDRLREGAGARRIDCLPLVYGYATYSGAGSPVCFFNAPALRASGLPGSVLGGTGLAVARAGRSDWRILAHLRQAMHPLAQGTVIPSVGGQPSATVAWESREVNERWNDFYINTRRTQDHAWRRPRHPGWIPFQEEGSRMLYRGLAAAENPEVVLDRLDASTGAGARPATRTDARPPNARSADHKCRGEKTRDPVVESAAGRR